MAYNIYDGVSQAESYRVKRMSSKVTGAAKYESKREMNHGAGYHVAPGRSLAFNGFVALGRGPSEP